MDQVENWNEASRTEVINAMKSLDRYSDKYASLNKAYREFNFAISKHSQPDLSDKVEELMEETSDKYKKFVEDVKKQDKDRELYSLAGANSEQVALPKGHGETSTERQSKLKYWSRRELN